MLERPPPPRRVALSSRWRCTRLRTIACPPRPPPWRPADKSPTAAATDSGRRDEAAVDAATRRPQGGGVEGRRRPPARPRHVRAQPREAQTLPRQATLARPPLRRCGRTRPLPPSPPHLMAPHQRRCGSPSVQGGSRGAAEAAATPRRVGVPPPTGGQRHVAAPPRRKWRPTRRRRRRCGPGGHPPLPRATAGNNDPSHRRKQRVQPRPRRWRHCEGEG